MLPKNHIINADFLLDDSIEKESVDGIFTDPPYYILVKEDDAQWDNQWKTVDEFIAWLNLVVMKCYGLLKENRYMTMFCSQYYMADTEMMLRKTPFRIVNRCIWNYANQTGMFDSRGLKLTWEPFFLLLKGNVRNFNRTEYIENNNRFFQDVKQYSLCKTNMSGLDQKSHPSQKPIGLMEEIVQLFSYEGETVFDPFMGSGTTAVAARRHRRHYLGYERNPDYIPLIQSRIDSDIPMSDKLETPKPKGGLFG